MSEKLITLLRTELRTCDCPRPINGATDNSTNWCVNNGHCGCVRGALLGVDGYDDEPLDFTQLKEQP